MKHKLLTFILALTASVGTLFAQSFYYFKGEIDGNQINAPQENFNIFINGKVSITCTQECSISIVHQINDQNSQEWHAAENFELNKEYKSTSLYFVADGSIVLSPGSYTLYLYTEQYAYLTISIEPICGKTRVSGDYDLSEGGYKEEGGTTYLPDTVICHRGAQICDENGDNCQTFYTSGTSVYGCDSTITRNVILKQDTTHLPDTTVCYGEWVSLSGTYEYRYVDPFEQSQWGDFYNEFASEEFISEFMEMGSQTDYYQWYAFQTYWGNYMEIHGECDEQTKRGFETWYKSHFHDYAPSCPDGIEYVIVSSDGQQCYSSRVYTRTYTNLQGCDSVVSRKVNVISLKAPHIEVSPEQDTFNSGKIKIYDVYCTDSRYVGCNERDCDPYEYTYAYAKYDYITINGVVYNYASKSDSIVSFKDNGYKNRGNVNNPDYLIENLPAGEYHIVFYSSCDSIAQDITIESKGIEIDGIYYKYVPEDYRNEGLKVTYRGTSPDEYDEYFGDIVIPDSAIYNGKKLPVRYIDMDAFEYCSNISSISFKNPTPPCDEYGSHLILYIMQSKLVIYVPFGALDAYKKSYIQCNYFNYDYTHYYRYISYYFPVVHVIHPQNVTIETSSTTSVITIGNADYTKHISSCGIIDEEEYPANVIVYSGLDPNTEYTDIALYVKTIEGDYDTIHCSFTTPTLELTTKPSKPVSATTAILLAETNMSDAEVNCGFEYKRNDAPADMSGTKVYCPVASGQMAGRLKNLKDDVYYKYRAFYQSQAGNMYYGDWQYIFTGDMTVEFDPVLYTYSASVVKENEATLGGYALAGSEDFTEQGFEYWAESRVNEQNNAPQRMAASIGEHKYAQASGIKMSVTLTDLDEGTVYKYRAYGKTGNQFFYGSEQTFTTQGEWHEEQGIEDVLSDKVQCTKILRDGQIYIMYKGTMYNVQGQKVK